VSGHLPAGTTIDVTVRATVRYDRVILGERWLTIETDDGQILEVEPGREATTIQVVTT